MLVTFQSKASSSITMFGDVALTLLRMMGLSETVPGALLAADIPAALARLNRELAAVEPDAKGVSRTPVDTEDVAAATPVGLRLRAYPLIQLLSAAARQDCNVLWDKGHPAI